MSGSQAQIDSSVAGKLPHGWSWSRIGDFVAEFVGGCSPTKRDYTKSGFLVLNKGNIKPHGLIAFWSERKFVSNRYASSFADRTIRHSDLVVTLRDLSQKADFLGLIGVYRETEEALLTQGAYLIQLREGLEQKFLVYYSNSPLYREFAKKSKHGSTQVHLRNGDFLGFHIPIPPLTEQRRIVAEIEKQFTRLEAAVAALRRIQANLKRYRAAVLKAACEGRLVPTEAELTRAQRVSGAPPLNQEKQSRDGSATLSATFETGEQLLQRILTERRKKWTGRGKYNEPTTIDTANVPPLPEGWTWASVGQLGEIKGGKRLPMGHDYSPTPTAFPYIRVLDFENYGVRQGDLKFLREETQREIQRYTISKSDVYISIAGSIGVVGVVPDNLDGANLTENAAKITSLSFVAQKYICFWLSSNTGRSFVADKTIATTQAKLALFRIEVIPIPLPPLAEQTRIVAEVERRLSVTEELETMVSANLQRTTRLRQAILQRAFAGKLLDIRTQNNPTRNDVDEEHNSV